MCGLCGFGMTDAHLVLGLKETKPLELTDEIAETVDSAPVPDPVSTTVRHECFEGRAARRSFSAALGRALALLRVERKRSAHAAHGF